MRLADHGVAPDVVDHFVGTEHAGDQGPLCMPIAHPSGVPITPSARWRYRGTAHRQRHLGDRNGVGRASIGHRRRRHVKRRRSSDFSSHGARPARRSARTTRRSISYNLFRHHRIRQGREADGVGKEDRRRFNGSRLRSRAVDALDDAVGSMFRSSALGAALLACRSA